MRRGHFGLMLSGMVTLLLSVTPALADSHARIVRLSYIDGNVQIDRNLGQGYEKAILNMPLTEGMKVATNDGRVEIEFEDSSTVRLTPKSELEFTQLALRDSGGQVSTLTLKQGQAYVNYENKQKENEFTVAFARERVRLDQAAHFRVDVEDASAQLAVFKGDLQVEGPSGKVDLTRNRTVTFDLAADDKYEIAKNVEEDPFDAWDKQLDRYQQQYAKAGSYKDYPYGYGVSDLNYYGNYYDVPGYGQMWQPYFVGVGWNPFMDGAWMYYPGCGYTWVSAYPWGWMPYRYGSWAFVPGYGWMWQPGGWGGGWYTVPAVVNPPGGFVAPQPPNRGTSVVSVGRGPATSPVMPPRRITVQSGSAGWGVPRGTVSNLGRVSHTVQQNGFATVRSTPPSTGTVYSPTYSTGGSSASSGGYSGASHAGSAGASHGASMGGHSSAPPHR
jgi:uncharacterized protein DUF6600/FecR-like protein